MSWVPPSVSYRTEKSTFWNYRFSLFSYLTEQMFLSPRGPLASLSVTTPTQEQLRSFVEASVSSAGSVSCRNRTWHLVYLVSVTCCCICKTTPLHGCAHVYTCCMYYPTVWMCNLSIYCPRAWQSKPLEQISLFLLLYIRNVLHIKFFFKKSKEEYLTAYENDIKYKCQWP